MSTSDLLCTGAVIVMLIVSLAAVIRIAKAASDSWKIK